MRTAVMLLVFAATVSSSAVNAASSESVLTELRNTLRHARSSPRDLKLDPSCPNKLSELVGLSKAAILDALGNPDLQEDVVSRESDPFTLLHYYLGPEHATVTFKVGSSNVVSSVSCA